MIPGLSITKLLIIAGVVVGGGIGAYSLFRSDLPQATPLDTLPDLVHDRIADEITRELPETAGDARLILPPVGNDRLDALRTRLARRIDRSGRYEAMLTDAPEPASWWEEEVVPRLPEWLEAVPGIDLDSDVAPWLLEARVVERQDDDDALALAVVWHLRDLRTEGRRAASGDATSQIDKSLFDRDYLRWRIGESSPWFRVIVWLALVFGPWIVLRSALVELLRKESNGWNAALWVGSAAPGIIAGYVLTAFAAGWWGGVSVIGATVATLVFSYGWLNWLDSTRR